MPDFQICYLQLRVTFPSIPRLVDHTKVVLSKVGNVFIDAFHEEFEMLTHAEQRPTICKNSAQGKFLKAKSENYEAILKRMNGREKKLNRSKPETDLLTELL